MDGQSVYKRWKDSTMRDDYRSSKGHPFAMFLYADTADEETGDVQFGLWTGRYGRRLIQEDSMGFVSYERYASIHEAIAVFEEIAEASELEE